MKKRKKYEDSSKTQCPVWGEVIGTVMCWDHCNKCQKSQNRYWVKCKADFEKQSAKRLGHRCIFCGGKLESYNEKDNPI